MGPYRGRPGMGCPMSLASASNHGATPMTARPAVPCRGPSRRSVLRAGVLTALGLGLDDWLRLRALATTPGAGAPVVGKARNCILIWLAGGPSHIDTFDPKPDAPQEYRGEFKPIDTAVAGVQVSEVFPNLAKVLDRLTLIR